MLGVPRIQGCLWRNEKSFGTASEEFGCGVQLLVLLAPERQIEDVLQCKAFLHTKTRLRAGRASLADNLMMFANILYLVMMEPFGIETLRWPSYVPKGKQLVQCLARAMNPQHSMF